MARPILDLPHGDPAGHLHLRGAALSQETSRARTLLVAAVALALIAVQVLVALTLSGPARVGVLAIACALGCAMLVGASSRRARTRFYWIAAAAVMAAPYLLVIFSDERWRSR